MPVKVQYSIPYQVSTSFAVPFNRAPKRIDTEKLGEFWTHNGYGEEVGCYVFATMWGSKCFPWYVGKTNNSFRNEAFQAHKLLHYNAVLSLYPRYKPRMFFVCRAERRGRPELSPYDWLETELIKLCAQVNPAIRNEKKVRQTVLMIQGVTDRARGRKSSETHDFRKMLSLGV